MELSISFKKATKMTSIKHNNRDFSEKDWDSEYHKHIDKRRTKNNVILKQEKIQDSYVKLFQAEVDAYNKKQKRRDRRIKNFYEYVCKKNKNLEPQREFVVQVGDLEDFYSEDGNLDNDMFKQANEILIDYYSDFQERNPNLYVYNAVIHNDETTPHLHLNVIPVATGYKKGVNKQPSFDKALKQQDIIYSKQDSRSLFQNFRDQEIDVLEKSLQRHNIIRKVVGKNYIKDIHQYKREMRKIKVIKKDVKELEFEQKLLTEKRNDTQFAIDKMLQRLNAEDNNYICSEVPKKVPLTDKVAIPKKDYVALKTAYTANKFYETDNINLKRQHQNDLNEISKLKNQKSNLKREFDMQKKDDAETISYLKFEKIALERENYDLKCEKEVLKKETQSLKKTIKELTKKLETTTKMFKDIVQISVERGEMLRGTVTKFIQKQTDRLIQRWDNDVCYDKADNIAISCFKKTIYDTFGNTISDDIVAPVIQQYNKNIDNFNANKRRNVKQKIVSNEKQRNNDWEMTL